MSVSRAVTQEKIDEAVRRLVEVARPSRIILFGSAARGQLHDRSDVDLMVVLPEAATPNHGEAVTRCYSALAGIPMAKDIIVVTEDRLAELGDRPGLVYRQALRGGKVVYEAPDVSPQRGRSRRSKPSDIGLPHTWLAHARSDLASARLLRANPDILPEQAGFHAQQAIEKALKAILLARNVDIPYTHDLQDLVDEIATRGMAVPTELAQAPALTRFAVQPRYPTLDEVTEADVDDAIRIAEATLTWATPLVPLLRK